MCHPGKPSPHGLGHFRARFAPALFQRAKSSGWRLFGSTSSSCRWPARNAPSVLPLSLPYWGKVVTS